jgi:hypothetical protein
MTLSELHQKYDSEKLASLPGDQEFRYYAFSPFFRNLEGKKAIIHDRFTALVRLENIVITQKMFEATVHLEHTIKDNLRKRYKPIPQKWEIGANWAFMGLVEQHFFVYSGWSLWPETELVAMIEKLIAEKNFTEAYTLTSGADF